MNDDEFIFFESRLLKEIEEIESKIKALTSEKMALSKQLQKAKMEKDGLQFSTRKNSVNRILIENSVIYNLRAKRDKGQISVSSDDLYKQALFLVNDLKKNTFRTYLNRMKNKGLIKNSNHVGFWTLA